MLVFSGLKYSRFFDAKTQFYYFTIFFIILQKIE
nr:MAG TPA: hypothetical protein [Bacteriophage sp.]